MTRTKEQNKKKKTIILIVFLVSMFALIYPMLYVEMANAAVRDDSKVRVMIILNMPGDINFRWRIADMSGNTPLEEAIFERNYDMMALLLKSGANPNNKEGSIQPLEYVLDTMDFEGMYDRTRLLVENGADLTLPGGYGDPLIKNLFTRGIQLNDIDYREESNAEVLRTLVYLVEHGISVNADHPWHVYLTYIVESENYGVLEFLFNECDVGVDEQEYSGETALMRAAKLGNAKMVEFLMGFGADKTLQDKEGMTALDFALEGGFSDVIVLLEN